LQPGESVFIPAATGGVGYVAVQLARLYGASRVFGGASTNAKRALVRELGAIPIDYTQPDWPGEVIALNGGNGVDLALEVIGGESVYQTLEATRAGGRVVNFGNITDTNAPVNPRALLRRNQTLTGFSRSSSLRDGLFLEERKTLGREIRDYLAGGKVRSLIGGRYKLEEIADAHRALEGRRAAGKVILLPNG
jgi:NADPH2:quinone reductase